MVRVLYANNYDHMSAMAANIIAAQMTLKPDSVLGLATGSTPIGTYKKLIEKNKAGEIDFAPIKTVNLDEYCGLDGSNDQSYRYFMNDNLFNHVNIDKANTYVPNGKAEDFAREGAEYDALVASLGGQDIQLLGLGLDGHIGFNEPCPEFIGPTHEVELDPSTIEANARFFASKDDVPTTAITMGIGTIMKAKKILLIASGKNKKEIFEKTFFGPVTPEVPASILQFHPDVVAIYTEG